MVQDPSAVPPDDEPIPGELLDLVTSDVVATVAAHRPDGTIAMYEMWVDYDGRRLQVSSAVGSQKARHWARDPHVTLSVVDHQDPWRSLVIRGRVTGVRPDEDLAWIDRISDRYVATPYRRRDRPREIFDIEIDDVQARRAR